MKNDHMPLIQALKKRAKGPQEVPSFAEPKRMMDLKNHELHTNAKPGDSVKFHVVGKIKSLHDDGHAMVEVHNIQNENQEETSEKENQKGKEVRVLTQESHS